MSLQAFEDSAMHGEDGAEKKQRVVDILLYIMVESGQGFSVSANNYNLC